MINATALVIGSAPGRLPGGGTTPVFIVGSDLAAAGLHPWNLVEGDLEALDGTPNAVAVDQLYFKRLGISAPFDALPSENPQSQASSWDDFRAQ